MKNDNGIEVNNGLCLAGKCWVLHAESPKKRSTTRAHSQPTEHQGILALVTCELNQLQQIFTNETFYKKRKWRTWCNTNHRKRLLDTFISENITVASRQQIKYALICFMINLGMTGCKALSAHRNMTLKLLWDCQAHLAKLDNTKTKNVDKKYISRYLSCRILHILLFIGKTSLWTSRPFKEQPRQKSAFTLAALYQTLLKALLLTLSLSHSGTTPNWKHFADWFLRLWVT